MTTKQLRRLQLALEDSALKDLISMSDAEIDAALREEGLDPDQVIRDMRAAFARAFAEIKSEGRGL
jgi:hypothetical protein